MARFCGQIGFSTTEKTAPGVWTDQETVPHLYRGDLIRAGRRWEKGESLNDDLIVNNYVSVVADDFLLDNLYAMKWVECLGAKWKVSSVELEYPRVKITLGGVWNG